MLRLDINAVPEGVSHVDLSTDASELGDPLEGGRLEGSVQVGLDVTRKGQDLYLKGAAGVRAVLECDRCLEEYACDLEAPVELWVKVLGAAEGASPEVRENLIEVESGSSYADFTGHIRSELLLQMPFKQVCKPDCKGLCPVCGTNLNKGSCKCRREAYDGRWEALKEIKKKL
jgi:uncharacterized protein